MFRYLGTRMVRCVLFMKSIFNLKKNDNRGRYHRRPWLELYHALRRLVVYTINYGTAACSWRFTLYTIVYTFTVVFSRPQHTNVHLRQYYYAHANVESTKLDFECSKDTRYCLWHLYNFLNTTDYVHHFVSCFVLNPPEKLPLNDISICYILRIV